MPLFSWLFFHVANFLRHPMNSDLYPIVEKAAILGMQSIEYACGVCEYWLLGKFLTSWLNSWGWMDGKLDMRLNAYRRPRQFHIWLSHIAARTRNILPRTSKISVVWIVSLWRPPNNGNKFCAPKGIGYLKGRWNIELVAFSHYFFSAASFWFCS